MPVASGCPEVRTYRHLLQGQLPVSEIEALAHHLERCGSCLSTFHELQKSDTLVRSLRRGGTPHPDEPVNPSLSDLMAHLISLAPERISGTLGEADLLPIPRAQAGERDFLAPPRSPDEMGRLGAYRVLKELGAGGMGIVFLAEDPKLRRRVALKVLRPGLTASESARQRFLREAQAIAGLEHEHIVVIYEVSEDRGIPFFTMPVLQGESLETRVQREGVLPLREALRIGREVAEGLAAAHACRLIHRDVKPGNIWLEQGSRRVKLLDFGLARATGDGAHLTQTGVVLGTPAYMAPEQARGEEVDARSDLFSLGCVLYRICTGEEPFKGADPFRVMTAVAMYDPPPPPRLNPEVPPALSALIVDLLAKDRSGRPASADAVVKALRAIEADRSQPAIEPPTAAQQSNVLPTPSLPQSTRRPKRWSRRGVAVAAAALTLVLLGIVLFWPTKKGTIRIEINDPAIEVTIGKKGYTIKGADKQEITFEAGEHGLKIKRGDLEFETDKFVLRKGERVTLKIELLAGKVQVVQGDRVLGEGSLAKTADGSPFEKLDPAKIPPEERFRGMPREVVAVLGHRLPAESNLLGRMAISSDGRLVLVGCADGSAILWDVSTGQDPKRLWGKPGVMVGSVALSADGRRALGGGWNQPIFVWDVASGEVLFRIGTDEQLIGPLAFDPADRAGRRALVGHIDARDAPSTIRLWDVEAGKELRAYKKQIRPAYALAFSADGRRFVSCGSYEDETICLWNIDKTVQLRRLELEEPLTRGKHGGTLTSLAFSPCGRYVLAGGKAKGKPEPEAAWLWDVKREGVLPKVALNHPSPVFSVAFSPDGKTMATAGGDARVILWECPSGKKLREIRLVPSAQPDNGNISLAFAPDGRHLLVAHGNGAVYVLRLSALTSKQRE